MAVTPCEQGWYLTTISDAVNRHGRSLLEVIDFAVGVSAKAEAVGLFFGVEVNDLDVRQGYDIEEESLTVQARTGDRLTFPFRFVRAAFTMISFATPSSSR